MNSRMAWRISLLSAALCMLALSVPIVSAQAPASSATAPVSTVRSQAIKLRVFAQQPDGSFATDVTFKLLAQEDVFVASRKWPETLLGLGRAPSEWLVSDPSSATPAELGQLRAGVPFKVRILDGVGHVAGTLDCEPLLAKGEVRDATVPIVARRVLTVRVLDRDGHPVPSASIEVYDGDIEPADPADEAQIAAWMDRKQLRGTTDANGEWVVSMPLAPGLLRLNISADWFTCIPLWLDEVPADGAPFVVQLGSTSAAAAALTRVTLEILAREPDGSRATGVRFIVSADREKRTGSRPAELFSKQSLLPYSRSLAASAQAPTRFEDVLPDVPFSVRAVDCIGRGIGEISCPGLQPGETRLVEVHLPPRRVLTIRALDGDEHPVAKASIMIMRGKVGGRSVWPERWTGTTDGSGECVMDTPLAAGPLQVRASGEAWMPTSVQLSDLPPDGLAVIHLEVAHPVLIHAVDGAGRPVPLLGAILIDDEGDVSVAEPQVPAGQAASTERVESEWWRMPHVPKASARIRVFPLWGAEVELPSSRDTMTAVLSSHVVVSVSWDATLADMLGQASVLRLAENKLVEHRMTDEERARQGADLALPIGHWTLCLAGAPGGSNLMELPIDLSADGDTRFQLHEP